GGFAQAQHQARLDGKGGIKVPGPAQKFQRTPIYRLRPYAGIEARNGFHVMVQYIGAGCNDSPERFRITLKIGNQHLDEDAGDLSSKTFYRLREEARPAVRDIVTGNGG